MPNNVNNEDLFSDDSSFYGDEDEIRDLEYRASTFNPTSYWRKSHALSIGTIAASQQIEAQKGKGRIAQKGKSIIDEPATSRHPHDGLENWRQSTETVSSFLARLPPSTTQKSTIGPWIFIDDPNAPAISDDVGGLMVAGEELLRAFKEKVSSLEVEPPKKSRTLVARKINTERRKLEAGILQTARDYGVVTGKWMLFPSVDSVDEVWAAVAGATAKGSLGLGAKVATASEDGSKDRLICIYTRDFAEKEDIWRVLVKLVDMGLVERVKPIYYKCDAYTYLEISSGNELGLKASMHSSTDILAKKW